ncbi:MAG: alpha/beta fold hydrolase [Ilumatobacteraceae bacterium]
MPRATLSSGIELEYETFGSPSDPTLLLVMGFAVQLIHWDVAFCEMLAGAGYRVVRFDNRDSGLSTHLDGQTTDPMAVMAAMMNGDPAPEVPYLLSDMASDAIGLLDHLGVDRAHLVGASMGGMIVQTMAIEHPDRVASMVSVMSMPGDPEVGQPAPEAMAVLLRTPPSDREEYIEAATATVVFASKKHVDVERIRRTAASAFDRAFYPEGATRQLAAIWASGDRSEQLREVRVPSLVIHGRDDTLISLSGGERTAELIPGANLFVLADMGHDFPEPLWPLIVNAITSHTAAAIGVGAAV